MFICFICKYSSLVFKPSHLQPLSKCLDLSFILTLDMWFLQLAFHMGLISCSHSWFTEEEQSISANSNGNSNSHMGIYTLKTIHMWKSLHHNNLQVDIRKCRGWEVSALICMPISGKTICTCEPPLGSLPDIKWNCMTEVCQMNGQG